MKRRKLITPKVLGELRVLTELGVPLSTATARLSLDISKPAAKKLLDIYSTGTSSASLFPAWLDPSGPSVQEQPENYNYIGFFPLGYWECKSSSI